MSTNTDTNTNISIEVNGHKVSFAVDTKRCENPSELATRIAEYAANIGDILMLGKEARDYKRLESNYRDPMKQFMVENGVMEIASPDGTAKLCTSKANQPNKELARKLLSADDYRRVFEEKREIEVLRFTATGKK